MQAALRILHAKGRQQVIRAPSVARSARHDCLRAHVHVRNCQQRSMDAEHGHAARSRSSHLLSLVFDERDVNIGLKRYCGHGHGCLDYQRAGGVVVHCHAVIHLKLPHA